MGYTHYFSGLEMTPRVAELAEKIVELSDVKICGGRGEGRPEITDDLICLNGDASEDKDYESFYINNNKKDNFSFCKTARMPYDEVVTAVLTAAIYTNAPGCGDIDSDGFAYEWAPGVTLFGKAYTALYGKKPDMELLCGVLESQLGEGDESCKTLSQLILHPDKTEADDQKEADTVTVTSVKTPDDHYYILYADSKYLDISVKDGPMPEDGAVNAMNALAMKNLDELVSADIDHEVDCELGTKAPDDKRKEMKDALLKEYTEAKTGKDSLRSFLSQYSLDVNTENKGSFIIFDFNGDNTYIWNVKKI